MHSGQLKALLLYLTVPCPSYPPPTSPLPQLLFFFLLLLCLPGPPPWHTEVPRLGTGSEPQLPAYTTATAKATPDLSHICNPHHGSWQGQIPNPLSKGQGSNPQPQGSYSDSFLLCHNGNSHSCSLNPKFREDSDACSQS